MCVGDNPERLPNAKGFYAPLVCPRGSNSACNPPDAWDQESYYAVCCSPRTQARLCPWESTTPAATYGRLFRHPDPAPPLVGLTAYVWQIFLVRLLHFSWNLLSRVWVSPCGRMGCRNCLLRWAIFLIRASPSPLVQRVYKTILHSNKNYLVWSSNPIGKNVLLLGNCWH